MYARQFDDEKRGFFNVEMDGMYVEKTEILLISAYIRMISLCKQKEYEELYKRDEAEKWHIYSVFALNDSNSSV